jgi:ribonuclease HI
MNQLSLFDGISNSSGRSASTTTSRSYWKIFVDGASRNNPGPAGAGVYILKNNHVVEQLGYYLGVKTNNQAEYLALILGLFAFKEHVQAGDCLMIHSDSQLLVRQIEGIYKIKNALLKPLHAVVHLLLCDVNYSIAHVMREDNTHADELANKGIDQKIRVKASDLEFLKKYEISIYE